MAEEDPNRRLAAILMADVVGYSSLMEADEAGALSAVKQHRREVIEPAIAAHKGRVVKLMGDGTLVEFASVVDAVNCAITIQQKTPKYNAKLDTDRRFALRIGINLGDVIVEGEDIYGEGVNIAARLEGLAEPGGICLSGSVYDAISNKLSMRCDFLGEQLVKNLAKPVRIYRVRMEHTPTRLTPQHSGTAPTTALRPTGEPTLAIKPFEPLGSDPESADFADCLTNGVSTALSRLPGLILVSDESPSLQLSKQMSVQELGQRFAVRYLLKGQVRKLGPMIRVNAELIELSTGRFLWADKLDRELHDLGNFFAIQDDIIEELVAALNIKLVSGEMARIVRNVLKNPAAQECIYKGELLLWKAVNKLELGEAQRLFEEAIALEPDASFGYAEAALSHWVAAFFGLSDDPTLSLENAVALARQAIALDDVTGYPHLILAQVHLLRREFDDAKAEADEAVSARPSCPASFAVKASVLNYLGDTGDAVHHAQHAFRLSPMHPQIFPAVLATAYHGAARYEEAMAAAEDAIALEPSKLDPYLFLAASAVGQGDKEAARQAAQKVQALEPGFSLEAYTELQPYKDQKHLDRLLVQLRTAGLE